MKQVAISHLSKALSRKYKDTTFLHKIVHFAPLNVLKFVLPLLVLFSSLLISPSSFAKDGRAITIQLRWQHQFQFAGYYAALNQGYFANEGLNVQLKEGGPNVNVLNEVLEQRAQYGIGAGNVVYSRLNNQPLVIVSSIFQHSASALAVAKQTGISTPHDLISKQVNMLQGGQPNIEIAAMLEFKGVTLDKVQLGESKLLKENHTYNNAEYIYTSNSPYFFQKNNQKINIIIPRNYGVDFYGDALFTTEQELEDHPDTVEKMRKAVLKGWKYALQHPDKIIQKILTQYPKRHSQEHLQYEANVIKKLIQANVVEIGHTNKNRWQSMADTITRLKMLPNSDHFSGLIYQAEKHSKTNTNHLWGLLGFMLAIAGGISLLSIAFFAINRHLKKHIALKTKELQTKNEQLQNEVFHRQQAEKELQKNKDELENVVSLRTRELSLEVKEHQYDLQLLSHSEAKLQGLLSSMNDTVYLINERKKIAFFHAPSEHKTLINMQEDVLGKDLDSLIPHNVLGEFDKAIKENKKGNVVELDLFKDRAQRWFSVKLSPLFEEHDYRGSLAVSREISDRKFHELELEQATLDAKEANQIKGEFLASMSHEIRTPLNAVIGFYFLLMRTELDTQQKQHLQQIYRSSQSLCDIIDDILDFSKAEAGTLKFEATNFNLFKLTQQLQNTFSTEIRNKNITLDINIDQHIPTQLNGFKLRLSQVLSNLLSNAIKFSDENSSIHLEAIIESNTEDQYILNFKVKDHGIGIAKADIKKLFRPFSQLNTKLSRSHTGTGLGLSIAQNLVNVMGGTIHCQSVIDKGTSFSFSIPFDHQALNAIEKNNSKTDDLVSSHILIVDDDELNLLISSELLKPHVAKVSTAKSGKEAIALCQKESFSIILMDIQMPEMDGYQATFHIRENKDFSYLPIIAMTAHASQEDHDKSLEAGMNDHITKPIDPELLVATLRKWS